MKSFTALYFQYKTSFYNIITVNNQRKACVLLMTKIDLPDKLQKKIRSVMRNHGLAKFGDSLSNFIYSLAKTQVLNKPTGERVFDNALAEAVRKTDLRPLMPSSISSGDIGDGAEALVGYAYLEELMTIEEMVEIIYPVIDEHSEENYIPRKEERNAMMKSFELLLLEIIIRFSKTE